MNWRTGLCCSETEKWLLCYGLCYYSEEAIRRVRKLARCSEERLRFFNVDICNAEALRSALEQSPDFLACIHFAGLKAVGESVREPLLYYENNMISTLVLLKELSETPCRSLVFSSSATVYGTAPAPITEDAQVGIGITNPYGEAAPALLVRLTLSPSLH